MIYKFGENYFLKYKEGINKGVLITKNEGNQKNYKLNKYEIDKYQKIEYFSDEDKKILIYNLRSLMLGMNNERPLYEYILKILKINEIRKEDRNKCKIYKLEEGYFISNYQNELFILGFHYIKNRDNLDEIYLDDIREEIRTIEECLEMKDISIEKRLMFLNAIKRNNIKELEDFKVEELNLNYKINNKKLILEGEFYNLEDISFTEKANQLSLKLFFKNGYEKRILINEKLKNEIFSVLMDEDKLM